MPIEVVFKREVINLPKGKVDYEWAFQTLGDQSKLVFHFFLNKGVKDEDFFIMLLDSVQGIPGITYEISYTMEVDGHDLIIFLKNAFAKEATRSCIISELTKHLTKRQET